MNPVCLASRVIPLLIKKEEFVYEKKTIYKGNLLLQEGFLCLETKRLYLHISGEELPIIENNKT